MLTGGPCDPRGERLWVDGAPRELAFDGVEHLVQAVPTVGQLALEVLKVVDRRDEVGVAQDRQRRERGVVGDEALPTVAPRKPGDLDVRIGEARVRRTGARRVARED